ncbi:MAG TPA: hypothetical protein VMR44_00545 [Thermoanaerobaculia bacterium]|nr:hypothetical protein [Thermoanaerobaculia bacterium]
MKRKTEAAGRRAAEGASGRRWAYRLVRNTVLWLIPAAALWALLTPSYNRFLQVAGQNLVRITESPDATRLLPRDDHYAAIARLDLPPSREVVGSLRVTDLHFPVILLAALFLGVPDTPWRKVLAHLGLALVVMAVFHVVLVLFWVKFTYATQLGAWSLERYGAFARNFWGLGKHLLDLPVKLALPFLLWAWFYLDRLLPARVES